MTRTNTAKPRLLIAGLGKIGKRVAAELCNEFDIVGLRRSPYQDQNLTACISADLTDESALRATLASELSEGTDFLLYCLTPNQRSEDGYRAVYIDGIEHLLQALPNAERLKRIFFVSSTSVFHQTDEGWVDESSTCEPKSFAGKVLLEAEKALLEHHQPSTIVRFSGIYGGQRQQLIRLVQDAAHNHENILSTQTRLTNRIHEDDCVGFLSHLLRQTLGSTHSIEPLYIATDDCPVDMNEVIGYIASQLGLTLNPEKIEITSKRGGNKKISNALMRGTGYVLKYPSYKEGYKV